MKSSRVLLVVSALLSLSAWCANPAWQAGRIVEVQKDVNTKTLYWLVNTPITEDEISYRISVHLKGRILTGIYQLGKLQGPPPETWVKDQPVNTQIDGDTMFLQQPGGSTLKLKIFKRKTAPLVRPVTSEELAEAYATPSSGPDDSATGFIPPAPAAPAAAPRPVAPPPAPAAPTGTISLRTTPYLADLYLDGENMGYTPARINLPPGKHVVRFEKQGYKTWSKEFTLTAGSELLVDATLEKK